MKNTRKSLSDCMDRETDLEMSTGWMQILLKNLARKNKSGSNSRSCKKAEFRRVFWSDC